MKSTDTQLQSKVDALDGLLAAPNANDAKWFDQVLAALEHVAEYALSPGVPVRALSRAA